MINGAYILILLVDLAVRTAYIFDDLHELGNRSLEIDRGSLIRAVGSFTLCVSGGILQLEK